MDYIMVLQWAIGNDVDFDGLVELEDLLYSALNGGESQVDGHDFGSQEMNIFILTSDPTRAFEQVKNVLYDHPRWPQVGAAFRPSTGETYEILHPANLHTFTVA